MLVTGPTGSGKSTTLYAMLSRLEAATTNIMTVEDPIEYDLPGIGQTQVNARIDMSFARALRAILRQDPDVIMIGEIRDQETAQIAVQASLTGHLVLATLHTNDSVSAITRLVDMGIEPFLLSSSVLGILAQRLVRKLEPMHAERYEATPEVIAEFGLRRFQPAGTIYLYRPKPSNLSISTVMVPSVGAESTTNRPTLFVSCLMGEAAPATVTSALFFTWYSIMLLTFMR